MTLKIRLPEYSAASTIMWNIWNVHAFSVLKKKYEKSNIYKP